jgi:hypothetical protein
MWLQAVLAMLAALNDWPMSRRFDIRRLPSCFPASIPVLFEVISASVDFMAVRTFVLLVSIVSLFVPFEAEISLEMLFAHETSWHPGNGP